MDKIVYRDGIPCKLVKDGYKVSIWESRTLDTQLPDKGAEGRFIDLSVLRGPVGGWTGSGQREVRISRRLLAIPQADDRTHLATCDAMGQDFGVDVDLDELELKAKRSRQKSAARARKNCRHKIKHGGFRHMLTGTYRENMTDFDRMHRDLAAWIRKMRQVWPGFRYVYGLEEQDRGAWHFHCTVDTPKRFLRYQGKLRDSYEVFTLLWRDVVGLDNGSINVDGYTVKKDKKKRHADARGFSLAKMAGYVSKYLTKDHAEGITARRMWGSSEGLTPPRPICLEFAEGSLADLIAACFECPTGHRVARHWLNGFKDCWVLDTEPIPP